MTGALRTHQHGHPKRPYITCGSHLKLIRLDVFRCHPAQGTPLALFDSLTK